MAYYLNLESYQAEVLFQTITNYKTFIYVKLRLLEFLFTFWNGNKPIQKPYLYIDDKELHRVFLVNQDGCQIISFNFDFEIHTDGNHVDCLRYYRKMGSVEVRNIAEAIAICMACGNFDTQRNKFTNLSEDRIYYDLDFDMNSFDKDSFLLFERLAFSEPSYLRYDNSTIGYHPETHPKQHFDINYSTEYTYKIGLLEHLKFDELLLILNSKTYCPRLHLQEESSSCTKKQHKRLNKKQGKLNKRKRKKRRIR